MKAEAIPTTTGRRALLGAGAAAVAAGLGASLPAAAEAAPSAKEVELIRLCGRLVANRAEELRLYTEMAPVALDQEREMNAILAPGLAEWSEIEARLYELDVIPKTAAGISAVARAALAQAERASDGEIITYDLDKYLLWTVIKAIEPKGAVMEEAQTAAMNKAGRRALAEVAL